MPREGDVLQHCPCCGQSLATRTNPELDLDTNTLFYDDKAVRLSPSEAVILFMLIKYMPGIVNCERLYSAVYGSQDGPQSEYDGIRVWVCSIKRLVKPAGLLIQSHRERGYSLTRLKWEV